MMRRFTFFCMMAGLLLFTGTLAHAQGSRNMVTVEVFSGTWCTFCPGSALGADELVLNGKLVGVMEHHIGDIYETTETDARDGYYAVTGYPTTFFDGTISHVGGNATTTIYPTYLPLYDQAIAVATPFNMAMTLVPGSNMYTANVDITQMGAYSAGNLALHVVATESHIPDNWLAGLTEVNFVTRDMAPTEAGTPITIMMGQTVNQSIPVTIDASWDPFTMEIVAFLQNTATKEVFNTTKGDLFQPTGQHDAALHTIGGIPQITCATSLTPSVSIRNYGTDDITSLEISYDVNGGTASTYSWTGTLASGAGTDATLPAISFTPNATNNMVNVSITSINSGATEVSTTNNDGNGTFDSEADGGLYTIEIQPDNYGSETTWEVLDAGNNVLASGGPYTDGVTTLISETVWLSNDCFTFKIDDSYGDGICCAYGSGYYNVMNPASQVIASGGQFGATDTRDWNATLAVAIEDRLDEEVNLYPNPNNGLFTLNLGANFSDATTISIHDLSGKQVYQTVTGNQTVQINAQDLASGMYMVKIQGESGVAVKRFIVE